MCYIYENSGGKSALSYLNTLFLYFRLDESNCQIYFFSLTASIGWIKKIIYVLCMASKPINNNSFVLLRFHVNIHRKLSIIQCDKKLVDNFLRKKERFISKNSILLSFTVRGF